MSDVSQGPGWWQASDLKWYPPERHPNYEAPPPPPPPKLPPPSWAPPQQPTQPAPTRRSTTPWIIAGVAAAFVVVLVVAGIASYLMWPRPHASPTPTPTAQPAPSSVPLLPPFEPTADLGANCQYEPSAQQASKPADLPRQGKVPTDPAQVSVSMITNQGDFGLLLANNESPCTVNSFVSLAQQTFFDGTSCHRLTSSPTSFVLQCGDPAGDGTGGPGYQFANEYPTDQYQPNDPAVHQEVIYPRGTLAMANAGPNTNGSQFFMVYHDTELPPEYTVFGTLDQTGLATLDKIAAAGVAGGGQDGKPAMDVTISSIRLD